jgi:hypothetical protein
MQALATRFGFTFLAHEPGDKNRSARVERPFHYIENNFYPGRTFESIEDVNAQLRAWCDTVRRRPKRHLPNTPAELFAAEKPALSPLPLHVPEVYEVHQRRVGGEGYVSLHTNRYPVPDTLIDRHIQLHETATKVRVFDGHKLAPTCELEMLYVWVVDAGRSLLLGGGKGWPWKIDAIGRRSVVEPTEEQCFSAIPERLREFQAIVRRGAAKTLPVG